MEIVGVKINCQGKNYYFDSNGLNLKKDITVIVETEKGLQFGKVVSTSLNPNANIEYKKVIRISTKNDYMNYLSNKKAAKIAENKCKSLIKKYNINMKIIDTSYTFDKSQLIFRFFSDDRVDFRQLAKELGSIYKTRIELRQVGIRDKAKEIGGLGPCGRKLCCNNFLTSFDTITINMAKNQLLALNPNKINGVCGRLLCCLNYENDLYKDYKKDFPELGRVIETGKGTGKVISLDLFHNKYKILTSDNNVIEVEINDGSKK